MAMLCAGPVSALPEDAKQTVVVEGPVGSTSQADGWTVLKGKADSPAKVTQGSLVITGTEIRVLQKNDELQSATATGNPARFQQQPAKDKALVHGSGSKITFDNKTKILTLDDNAELNRDGNIGQSSHIEYNVSLDESSTGPVRMTIPPKKDDKK